MLKELNKKEVLDKVIDIFVKVIGFIPKEQVYPDSNLTKDFKIYTDDLSLFIKYVDEYFCLNSTPEEWTNIATLDQIANFVISHHNRPPLKKSWLKRLFNF